MQKVPYLTIRLFRLILLLVMPIMIGIKSAYGAVSISGSPVLDFGTIMQNAEQSVITLDYGGTITNYSGIFQPGGTSSTDQITYTTSNWAAYQYDYAKIFPENATFNITIPGCTASIRNVTTSLSAKEFSIRGALSIVSCRNLSTTQTLNYGATLVLDGMCDVGTYTGTISIPSTSEYCQTGFGSSNCGGSCDGTITEASHSVAISVTIDAPLSLTETQEMYFGAMLPGNGGTVTLDPQNGLSYSGVTMFDTSIGKSGVFRVSGVGGRQVHISLPSSATIYNDKGESMTINNFTASSQSIELPDTALTEAMESFSVGATLHVNANQQEGVYTGTYTVSVSY